MYLSTLPDIFESLKLGSYIKTLDLPETNVDCSLSEILLKFVDDWSWWISYLGFEVFPIFELCFG